MSVDDAAATEVERAAAREAYERVTRIIDYQTGGPQPPLVRAAVVVSQCQRIGIGAATGRSAIQAACDAGDCFAWRDADGRRYLGLDDAATLRRKVTSHAQRADDPATRRIGVANQRIDALRGDP